MKKWFPPFVAGLGAFLLVAGISARFYAYERLAVMPPDAEIDAVAQTSPDKPATYFDIGQLKEVTGPLTNRTIVRGDAAAGAEATKATGQDVVVWVSYACTGPSDENCLDTVYPMSSVMESAAFAAHGSEVVDWGGAYRDSGGNRDDDPDTAGYVYKLPFNVEKRDYSWYNADLGRPADLRYEGETEVGGLPTLHFTQDVPAIKVGAIDLPGSLAGSSEPTVSGDVMYSGRLEMDIEPESGVSMSTTSSPKKWVEVDGVKVVTMIDGTFTLDEATVANNVDTYSSLALALKAVRWWVPLTGVIVGSLLLVMAMALSLFTTRRRSIAFVAKVPAPAPTAVGSVRS